MNDLPDPVQPILNNQGVTQLTQAQKISSQGIQSSSGISSKEVEVGGIPGEEVLPLKDVGTKEFELPKEVASAGVKTQPTTIQIPPKVSQMGVTQAGPSMPVGTGHAVTLPLTDAQIAEGLKQSITSSWRWLAVWCERKLKQLHLIKREN